MHTNNPFRLRVPTVLLTFLLPLGADTSSITTQQAADILNELRQIRELLQNQGQGRLPEPQPEKIIRSKFNLKGSPMLGSKDAPLTIVEFTDYQCPFCQQFHETTFADLRKNYIETGKVRFFSRDMPLPTHRDALRAAEAARCAGEQHHFWEMREVLILNPNSLDMNHLVADATNLNIDSQAFRACIENDRYKESIQTDFEEATRVGVQGTPSFIVGYSTDDGVDGELIVGALPYSLFDLKLSKLQEGSQSTTEPRHDLIKLKQSSDPRQ